MSSAAVSREFRLRLASLALPMLVVASGCYAMRGTHGGGMTKFTPPRRVVPQDVALPSGYAIEPVAQGLTFPTGVTFDERGRPCVVESGYCYGEVFTTPRLLRVESDGTLTTIAQGEDNGPWTGVVFDRDAFFVAEGGVLHGGRILRIDRDGRVTPLISDLPSRGDHHTNGPAIGPDGSIYFGIGSATNSGVVGEDSAQFGWLARAPHFHDVPGMTITLTGENFETKDFRVPDAKESVTTGAFQPFGTPSHAGATIEGQVPCTAAVLRMPRDGGSPELVAWGLRNPFGLAFASDGQLYATENGYDERGSRPVWGAADLLWRVTPNTWYGWPDHSEGRSLTESEFAPRGHAAPKRLIANGPSPPPEPVARFGCHSSADGFDFSRSERFGHVGDAFVALFGDQAPATGKVLAPIGFKVARVDVQTGVVEDFISNRGSKSGPASFLGSHGLERPVAVRFDPDGAALYVVDFGVLREEGTQAKPEPGTGVLWKVTRTGPEVTTMVEETPR